MATPEEMDAAATNAARELKGLDPEAVKALQKWWKDNYNAAGHKRLARALLTYTDDTKADSTDA